MNAVTDQMEFRIFHNLFCEMFKIQRDAFAFDEYVHKVFEKFVMTVIEIRPIDWFIVMVVVVINLGRKKLKLDYNICEAHDTGCDEESTLKLFTIAGAVLYGITCVFVYVSRSLEFKIMAKRGVSSWKHYADYLQHMEVNADRAAEKRRLNVEELKAAVLIGKLHQMKKEKSGRRMEDRAVEIAQAARRVFSRIHAPKLFRKKLDSGNSPEAIEAIMKLALKGSSVKFDPLDPEHFGMPPRIDEEGETVEEYNAHHSGHHDVHQNPYVHPITSIDRALEALDGTESELYVDMIKAERRRSMQISNGSDRKYSTMAGGSNRSQAPSRKNTNMPVMPASAAVAPLVSSMPPLHRAGGTMVQTENDHLRQHLAEIRHSQENGAILEFSDHKSGGGGGGGIKSNLSSYENLHEIDLESQTDHLSSAQADGKPHRAVPTVYSNKVQIAPPLDKKDLDEKSIGHSSDLSDEDNKAALMLSKSEDSAGGADHVMNFDDAASLTSTVVTSSKQVLAPINGRNSPTPLTKQLSHKLILPKIENAPTTGLTLKPLPPIVPQRKRTLLASLTFGFGIAEESNEDEVSTKNSFVRSSRFQQMFMTSTKVAATAAPAADEIEAAEKPEKSGDSGANSRANSARGSTIMKTGSFLKKQFNNL